jgi:putative nucleotidyltransferase with HDIG domain
VAVSVAADLLVTSLSIPAVDEVFTAALLHDIGKIVLGNYVREDLEKIEDLVAKGISFEVAEFVVLGMDHASIGARILQNWSLPGELVNAVRWHHDPESCEDRCLLSDVVHVSDIVSRWIGYGKGRRGPVAEPSFEVIERLGLTPSLIDQLSEQTRLEMNKLEEILN